ncbi:MAG: isoprenyl transferase [Bacteroidia bacterium]|nr:isoprenyl transferase [Bacteroidia bacterium]MDW8235103.1 isoprenyl transferase [Bacteroidia bacterium]
MELAYPLDPQRIPVHVAIIMDGNGRWARKRGKTRLEGHRNALQAVRESVETAAELGVRYLTLYAFSTENWGRPQEEVEGLMSMLHNILEQEEKRLIEKGVRLWAIGQTDRLPPKLSQRLEKAIQRTGEGDRLTLTLALSYGARQDIIQAVQRLVRIACEQGIPPATIDEDFFRSFLWTKDLPDPELLIRTSGEQRLSNFLLWECAYTEFVFLPVLWPDFRREHFHEAVWQYQQRERRFGRVLS